jgi:hypothetical protein
MDNIVNNYKDFNFILIGENEEGNLLSLKSKKNEGKIDVRTLNNDLSLKFNDSKISFFDNNTYNNIEFDIKNQKILNINSNVYEFELDISFSPGLGFNENVFDFNEPIWKSEYAFIFQNNNNPPYIFDVEGTNIGYLRNDKTFNINGSFYMIDGTLKENIEAIGISFKTRNDEKVSIDGFMINKKNDESFENLMNSRPYKFGLYAIQNINTYIQIYESTTGLLLDDSNHFINNNKINTSKKGIYSNRFALFIESIQIDIGVTNSGTYSALNAQIYNVESDISYFLVQIGYLKIFTENDMKMDFNINFNNNSIGNIKTVHTENIVLNGIIYDKILTYKNINDYTFSNLKTTNITLNDITYNTILTSDDIITKEWSVFHTSDLYLNGTHYTNNLLTTTNIGGTTFNELKMNSIVLNGKKFTTILDETGDFKLDDYTTPTIFRSLFNPNLLNEINGQEEVIPFIFNSGYDSNILFLYDQNVTTKHIKKLKTLNKGILFLDDENELDTRYNFTDITLENITSTNLNTTDIISQSIKTDSITINNNILEWNSEKDKFEHNSNILLQNEIIENVSEFPPYIPINELYYYPYDYTTSYDGQQYIVMGQTYSYSSNNDMNYNIKLISYNSGTNPKESDVRSFIDTYIKTYIESQEYTHILLRNEFTLDGKLDTQLNRYIVYNNVYYNNENYRTYEYSDMIEYEFSKKIFLKYISFRLINKDYLYPYIFSIIGHREGNSWDLLFENTEKYNVQYYEDIYFKINANKKYTRFLFGVNSVFHENLDLNTNLCGFKRLKLHGYIDNENNTTSILKSNHFNINELYINNKTSLANQINKDINKCIINPEFTNDSDMYTISTFHINSLKNYDYDYNNLLRLSIFDDNNLDNHNTVLHQVGLKTGTTIYNIFTTDNYNNTLSEEPSLSIVNNKVGINYEPDVNNTNTKGLFVKDEITFINEKTSNISFHINENTIDNYRIELPYTKGTNDSYLYIENITDNIVKTNWKTLSKEFLIDKTIYIGSNIYKNIHDLNYNFPVNPVHVNKLFVGTTVLDNHTINNYDLTVSGTIYATTDITTDSDIVYKTQLEKIENPLDKINHLNGYTFFRNDTTLKRRFTGLVAQEVEKVLPEAILKKHDGHLRVMYGNIIGLLVEGIKELQEEIKNMKNK